MDESDETNALLQRLREGDRQALGELFGRHRERLLRMVRLRIDPRLAGRASASDVLQDAYLEVSARVAEYLRRPDMPFFLWLRFIAAQKLAALHRHHLGAKLRSARREVPLPRGAGPEATSATLTASLMSGRTGPLDAAIRAELRRRLQDALGAMARLDREVLALRHFEQLTNAEAAQVLGIREPAASKRYVRALERLKDILTALPDGEEGTLT